MIKNSAMSLLKVLIALSWAKSSNQTDEKVEHQSNLTITPKFADGLFNSFEILCLSSKNTIKNVESLDF